MTTSTIAALLRNVEFPYQDISVSDDGYIRLTAGAIRSLVLVHLISGLDEGVENSQAEGGCVTHISGYTEWVSQTVPVITLGWDWFLDCSGGTQKLLRAGKPSSNVMSVDCNRKDLGYCATVDLLCSFVDGMDWQLAVTDVIRKRYTPCQH